MTDARRTAFLLHDGAVARLLDDRAPAAFFDAFLASLLDGFDRAFATGLATPPFRTRPRRLGGGLASLRWSSGRLRGRRLRRCFARRRSATAATLIVVRRLPCRCGLLRPAVVIAALGALIVLRRRRLSSGRGLSRRRLTPRALTIAVITGAFRPTFLGFGRGRCLAWCIWLPLPLRLRFLLLCWSVRLRGRTLLGSGGRCWFLGLRCTRDFIAVATLAAVAPVAARSTLLSVTARTRFATVSTASAILSALARLLAPFLFATAAALITFGRSLRLATRFRLCETRTLLGM